jgi:uncharacterized SAM-binding protein YcdF (DUF218 family)
MHSPQTPPSRLSTSRRRRRWFAVILIGVAALGVSAASAGRLLVREDPVHRADAVVVLGGSWVNRWLEADALFEAGDAPLIVISSGGRDLGELELERRGIHVPGPADTARTLLVDALHVPAAAVIVLSDDVDNTAQEAVVVRGLARARGWRAVIAITDRASTRRAGFALRRELGPAVEVMMRAPRLDPYDPAHWWRTRQDVRSTLYELPKLVAYWFGLRG